MKHFFTLILTALFCNVNAQTYPWLGYMYNQIPSRGDLLDSSMAANHYHTRTNTLTQFNKKGSKKKRNDVFVFQFDDKGFVTSRSDSNSKNKKTEKYEYTYKDSFLIGYKIYKNGKLERDFEIVRNGKHKITDVIKKDGKGKVIFKQHNDFDEKIDMLTRIAYYDKNNKETRAVEYSYYEGDNMKQAKEYRKGKLKKVWNYTCDPKGTDEKKVKEMKVCKNVNVDENGNRVESNRIVSPNGDVELRVSTFDKNEKIIKQMVYDDLKHKLKSEWSDKFVNGIGEVVYKYYNKKEKPIVINSHTYDSSHKMLNFEYRAGRKLKRIYKNIFEYNDKNLITHSASFDSKDRKTAENIHTYN